MATWPKTTSVASRGKALPLDPARVVPIGPVLGQAGRPQGARGLADQPRGSRDASVVSPLNLHREVLPPVPNGLHRALAGPRRGPRHGRRADPHNVLPSGPLHGRRVARLSDL